MHEQNNHKIIRILSFCPYYPPHLGGLEKYADELNRNLADYGHTITVFTPRLPKVSLVRSTMHIGQGQIRLVRFPAWEIISGYPLPSVYRLLFWRQLYRLWQQEFDVVLSYTRFFSTSPLAVLYARIKAIPHVHVEHGSGYVISGNRVVSMIAYLYDQIIGRAVFRLSDLNISPSLSAQKFIYRFDRRPSPLIYRGLPRSRLERITPDQTLRQKHPDRVIIVFAGRFIFSKGILDLIKAVSLLPPDRYLLCLIGSGMEQLAIAKEIKAMDLENNVLMQGELPWVKIIALLKASDIVVNPSYSEGLPTIVLEAGALGRAIIATDAGGTAEIVTPGESALLYEPGDIKVLGSHLKTLLASAALRQKLGQAASRQVIERFNWSHAVNQYLSHLSRLVAAKPK